MNNPAGLLVLEVDNFYMNEFTFSWIYLDQPGKLIFRKPKREGYTAVIVENNSELVDKFIERAKLKANVQVHVYK